MGTHSAYTEFTLLPISRAAEIRMAPLVILSRSFDKVTDFRGKFPFTTRVCTYGDL